MVEEAAHREPGALDRCTKDVSSDSSTWTVFTVLYSMSKMGQFPIFKKLVIEEKKCSGLACLGAAQSPTATAVQTHEGTLHFP